MKLYRLIIMVLAVGLVSCQKEKNLVVLTGTVKGEVPQRMEYSVPLKGVSFFGFKNSVPLDSLGNFHIELDIETPCFVELFTGNTAYGAVIVEPGMHYQMVIDTEAEENTFSMQSENKEGQDLYNRLANKSMILGHFELEGGKYLKDSVATEIEQDILKAEEVERAGFKDLLDKNMISRDFYDLVRLDREYFYSGVQGSVAFLNYLFKETGRNKLNETDYTEMWKEAFQIKPVTDPELMRSPWFFYYVQNFLRYKELIEESVSTKKLGEISKEGQLHTHNIEKAKQYLSGPQLEYYYAAYMYFEAINKNYERELITLFEAFKTAYPSSDFTPFIEPEIVQIVQFHKKLQEPLDEAVKFVEDFEEIDSLKDFARKLGGERIYVDVWATWCGPCKEEFEHNVALRDLLRSKNVTPFYLSIDNGDREERWREMVHYYDLKGYHIRANEKLVAELREIRGKGSFAIPWYILIDGNGNIIQKYMEPPSQIKNLEKQLSAN